MKILQLIDIPWDSGLANYALAVSQGLKARGHQMYISANPGEKPWAKARRLGLKTVPLATMKRVRALRDFVGEHGFDVLNAHTGSTHSLAVAAAFGQRVAVVRTRSDARRARKRLGGTLLFHRTQRVITAANYIRRDYIDVLGLPEKKIITIYQGVDLDKKPSALPKSQTIGVVARLDPVKGHRYILEAMSLLRVTYPEIGLLIVGQEESVKERDLRVIAERLRLENRVEFAGFRTDIAKQMSRCVLGVIPSTGSEAVSRATLEWMAAGRAVVASEVGCLPELVRDRSTGVLVPPKNAPALATALATLLQNRDRLETMGRAARERAEDEFSMDEMIDKTERVYEDAKRDVSR